ncbi:MAG: hypothetical protein BroJett040_03450 [Oligoflexia bacterium]|nr:MAG: hypothetical protein BroJett040_03450 [Oligoflexia bacterium]
MKTLLFFLLSTTVAFAAGKPEALGLLNGQNLAQTSLSEALSQVRPGTIIVLGEQHGTQVQANQQMQVLKTLKENGFKVSVGMEFFEYPQQALVDSWRSGRLTEADFLSQIGWGKGFPFSAYRDQTLFPQGEDQTTIGINAPRSLTGKIAKNGLDSLTSEEWKMLPPQFTLGNEKYLKRFKEAMGGHVPDQKVVDRYFAAQSAWDDTMAWQTEQFMARHSDHVFVIIVGEFHVQYGGGLPDRLKARGIENVLTFSLLNLNGYSPEEQEQSLSPGGEYGPRADYIWTSDFE